MSMELTEDNLAVALAATVQPGRLVVAENLLLRAQRILGSSDVDVDPYLPPGTWAIRDQPGL